MAKKIKGTLSAVKFQSDSFTINDVLVVNASKEIDGIAQGTAFNKNFGNANDEVCEGNDPRLGTKNIDETNIANNRIQVYNSTSGNLEYQNLVSADVGLGNVNNTSDINKPISSATQTALNTKQATLVSGTNIKTINSQSLLGSGDIVISSSALDINTLPSKATVNDNDRVVIGDSEAGFATKTITALQFKNQNSAEMLVEVSGETRDDFVSYIDIPINLIDYEKNIISVSNLQNNTNNIRLRGIFVDNNNVAISTNFSWSGSTRDQANNTSPEYNTPVAYLPIASERMTNGVGINNLSAHNLTIQAQGNQKAYIHADYSYQDTGALVSGGYVDVNCTFPITYNLITGFYTQSTVYGAGVDVSVNQALLSDGSVSTGAGTLGSGFNFIQIDLGIIKSINRILLSAPDGVMPGSWAGGGYTNGCDLQYSNDGTNWTTITTLSGFNTGTTQEFLNNINARYVRIMHANGYAALSEFKIYSYSSENFDISSISYIRIYATTGLVKGTFYVHGLKKTNALVERTTTLKPISSATPISAAQAINAISTPLYA
jgi:hypothetical protein